MPEADRPADRLRMLVHRAELAGQYHRAARARQLGMHQVELTALEHLVVAGGLTPGELGHRLGLTSGGVTALAGRLIAAGYVVRTDHPTDRRMRVLTATEAGRAYNDAELEPVVAPTERAVEWLAPDDAERLAGFLELLVALKESAAAATPGPDPEPVGEPYEHAALM
jgi:DNA-binding MarR family transcriptional regulator